MNIDINTLKPEPPTLGDSAPDAKTKAPAAAARIRELRKGVTLDRPEGMSLRDYAHLGHKY